MRAARCIPTESGAWVTPPEALVCTWPAARQLLTAASAWLQARLRNPGGTQGQQQQQLQALLAPHLRVALVHPGVACLHASAPLRALLGVGVYTPARLLELAKVWK